MGVLGYIDFMALIYINKCTVYICALYLIYNVNILIQLFSIYLSYRQIIRVLGYYSFNSLSLLPFR